VRDTWSSFATVSGDLVELEGPDGGRSAGRLQGHRAGLAGYGKSSAPAEAEVYTPYHTVGDVVAVLDAAGVSTAVIVGHDWGANVAWTPQ
jgi:pimeloyl-ACP methyl ester carboxylesterase